MGWEAEIRIRGQYQGIGKTRVAEPLLSPNIKAEFV